MSPNEYPLSRKERWLIDAIALAVGLWGTALLCVAIDAAWTMVTK